MPKAKAAPAPVPQEQKETPMQFDVRVYPVKTDGALRANASVNINGFFAVTNVRILEGSKGTFVSLPQYRGRNGEYKDICFPCTREAKAAFDKAVLTAYEQKMEQSQTAAAQDPPAPQEQEQGQQMAGM